MFRKFSNSLVSPKEIAKYYHEPFWKSFLFFIIMILFIMIPTVLNLSTDSFLSDSMKKQIKSAFYNEEIPFVIEDGTLKNVNNDHEYKYINKNFSVYHIVFTEEIGNYETQMDTIVVLLSKDGVYLKLATMAEKVFDYTDYEYFKNIDFTNKDLFNDISFWDNVFNVIESSMDEGRVAYVIVYSIYYIFYWVFYIAIFCLLITLFSKMRTMNYLRFWDLFKVSVYSLSPFIICAVLSTLFNLGLLMYIGYLLSAIYNVITVNEILKKLYITRKEGE